MIQPKRLQQFPATICNCQYAENSRPNEWVDVLISEHEHKIVGEIEDVVTASTV